MLQIANYSTHLIVLSLIGIFACLAFVYFHKSQNQKKFDRYLFFGALVGLLICAMVLFNEHLFFKIFERYNSKLSQVGKITKSENDTRRRSHSEFAWVPAWADDFVYEMDTIYTGKDSTTTIECEGFEVSIGQLTLVKIQKDRIQFDQGSINLNLFENTAVRVRAGKKEFAITSKGHVKIQTNRRNEVIITGTKGNSEVKIDGEVYALKEGSKQVLSLAGLGPVSIDTSRLPSSMPKFSAIFPQNGASIPIGKKKSAKVYLEWESQDPDSEQSIQVSGDSGFSKILYTAKTDTLFAETAALPKGTYYWRVKTGNAAWGEASKFIITTTIKALDAPEIKNKYKKYEIDSSEYLPVSNNKWALLYNILVGKAFAQQGSTHPVFEWTPVAGAKQYQLQVSDSERFTNIVIDETVSGSTYEWKKPKAGKFFWRVRTIAIEDEDSGFGDIASIEVVQAPAKIAEVKPIAPMAEPAPSVTANKTEAKLENLEKKESRKYLWIESGMIGALGPVSTSDGYVNSRQMDMASAFAALSPRFDYHKFLIPYLVIEYRFVNQLRHASDTQNQNMSGAGYLASLMVKSNWTPKWSSFVGLNLAGTYDLSVTTTLGGKTSYSAPSGYFLFVGYKVLKNMSALLTYNSLSYKNWTANGTTTTTSQLKQSAIGAGFAYEFD